MYFLASSWGDDTFSHRKPIANIELSFCLLVARDASASMLQAQLRQAGLHTEVTQELITPEQVPARATAVVWFVDGDPAIAVVASVGRLREQRPGLRIALVTIWPDELTALLVAATGRVAPAILRQPTSATDILAVVLGNNSADNDTPRAHRAST